MASVTDRSPVAQRMIDAARDAEEQVDLLLFVITVLAEVPGEIRKLETRRQNDDLSGPEWQEVQMQLYRLDEVMRLARLYAMPGCLDHIAVEDVIKRLSEGLAS